MSEQSTWTIPEWTPGDRFRKAREVLGLSQTGFAKLLGITKTTVSNYETGSTTNYRTIIVRQWALATGVSERWILTGHGDTGPDTPGGLPNQTSLCMTDDLAAIRARRSTALLPSTVAA